MTALATQLEQVRLAYRLVVAYQRRLLDLAAYVHAGLQTAHPELKFSEWQPSQWSRPGVGDPTQKWAWDFVPLHHCDIGWRTAPTPAPGAFWFWLSHEADTGWQRSSALEPDALSFVSVDKCQTLLRATFIALPAARPPEGASGLPDWQKLYNEVAATMQPSDWYDGVLRGRTLSWSEVRVGGVSVSVDQLPDRSALSSLLVEPVLKLIADATA